MSDHFDEAAVAAAWDGNATAWTEAVRAGADRYRELYTWPAFLARLPELAGCEVIDLGCGEGENTRRLARRGLRMTGVDLSERMIAAAVAAEAAEPLGIRYQHASFTRLDGVADASFDAAVSTMALMDGPDFAGAAAAVLRVVRPGGSLTFSVLHPCFITPRTRWPTRDYGSERHLEVGDYFSGASFEERWAFSKAGNTGAPPFRVPRFGYRLEDYANGLCAAGWQITGFSEPRPGAAAAAEHPWLRRWRRHAPLILIVSARRPE